MDNKMINKRIRLILCSQHDFLEDEIFVTNEQTSQELAKSIDGQFDMTGQAMINSGGSVYFLYKDKIAQLTIYTCINC